MTGRLAAFLRGINLGKRRVKSARLREPFEAMGLAGVATFLASGNVVFEDPESPSGPALERKIEARLEAALGFPADTFVRSLAGLADLVGLELLADARDEGFRPHVILTKEEPDAGVRRALAALEGPEDRFRVAGRDAVWLRRGRLSDSSISNRDLEAAFSGSAITMRNLNTIERMVEKFGRRGAGDG